MYVRTILPSAGRVSLCRNRQNANHLTRIDTIKSTRLSLHTALLFFQRGGRYISHRTVVLATDNEDICYRQNSSFDGKDNNFKAEWKKDVGGDAKNKLSNSAMIRNLAMQTVSNPRRSIRLNTLSGKIMQSRKNNNRSNGKDNLEKSKCTINDETKVVKEVNYYQTPAPISTTTPPNQQLDAKRKSGYGMISKQTEDQISSILAQAQSTPNLITIMRICSTPALSYFILTQQYTYALTGCVLAAISDGLDGYIARNYEGETVLGSYLDPFADKLVINCLALSLSSVGVLPYWCVGIWMGKDVLLFGGAYRAVALAARGTGYAVFDPAHTPLKIEPTFISKVNTILQFGTIGVGLGMASLDVPSNDIVHVLSLISCGTTVASGLSYLDGKSMTKSGNSMGSKTNNDDR